MPSNPAFSTGYPQPYGFSAALIYATIVCFYMMTRTLLSAATLAQPAELAPFATIGAVTPRKKPRISNRKSGIRSPLKSLRISLLQISNRKYSPVLRAPGRIAIFSSGLRSSMPPQTCYWRKLMRLGRLRILPSASSSARGNFSFGTLLARAAVKERMP